jgi:sugar lactone lactonase YvrE
LKRQLDITYKNRYEFIYFFQKVLYFYKTLKPPIMIKNKLLVAMALMAVISHTSLKAQGIMTTVAGCDSSGHTGDGGPATLATLNQPNDVCIDNHGNLYIADFSNTAVRRVDAATQIISTVYTDPSWAFMMAVCTDTLGNVYFTENSNWLKKTNVSTGIATVIAGTGIAGYSGDGGPASNAQMCNPAGICIDPSGNIYFSDYSNSRIRKIDQATGIISTIAGNGTLGFGGDGGPASAAILHGPYALCISEGGDLYFSDDSNFVIRKISASTGIISTVAGTLGISGFGGEGGPATSAIIGDIRGVCVDNHNNIYIDDISCSCRKIQASTGFINRIAGFTDTSGYNGDGTCAIEELMNTLGGVCVDNTTGNLFIADQNNFRIRKITQSDGGCPTELGVNSYIKLSAPEIYPNPSTGVFTIKTIAANAGIEVLNAVGQTIYSAQLQGSQNTIDLGNEPAGTYIVILNEAGIKEVKKLMINR